MGLVEFTVSSRRFYELLEALTLRKKVPFGAFSKIAAFAEVEHRYPFPNFIGWTIEINGEDLPGMGGSRTAPFPPNTFQL